jgi:hypothetical protein
VVKAGNGRRQCLGLKAPITRISKSGGAPFNGGNVGGGDATSFSLQRRWSGAAMGLHEGGYWRWLACSGSVQEEEEEGRRVPWS